jgi:hypothetical protein
LKFLSFLFRFGWALGKKRQCPIIQQGIMFDTLNLSDVKLYIYEYVVLLLKNLGMVIGLKLMFFICRYLGSKTSFFGQSLEIV